MRWRPTALGGDSRINLTVGDLTRILGDESVAAEVLYLYKTLRAAREKVSPQSVMHSLLFLLLTMSDVHEKPSNTPLLP